MRPVVGMIVVGGVAVAVIAGAAASPAAAQPGAVISPIEQPAVDQTTLEDPVAGRAWFSPTALTPPEGSFSFTSTELLIGQVSYSPADTVQISATLLVPIVLSDEGFAGAGSIKLRLLTSGRLRLSAYGSLFYAQDAEAGDEDLIAGLVGGVASLCLDERCRSTLSAFGAASLVRGEDADLPVILTVSWIQGFAERFKLVVEIDGAATSGEVDELSSFALLSGGMRLTYPTFAAELGAIGTIADGDFEVVPVPWVSLTLRGGL